MTVSFGSAGSSVSSAGATTLTPPLPTNNPGDTFVALVAIKNNNNVSTPTGWTAASQSNSGTLFRRALFYLVSTGSDADPVFTWPGSVACKAVVLKYVGALSVGAQGAGSANTTNPHTSQSITSTADSSLAGMYDFQSSATVQSSAISGWALDFSNGDATSAISFAAYSKQIGAIGAASGGTSATEQAVAWTTKQLEVLQATPDVDSLTIIKIRQGWRF